MTTLGMIGLGRMGSEMAANLLEAGYDVVGYDRRSGAIVDFEENGGIGVDSAAAVGSNADVVFLSLPDPPVVEAVVEDLEPELAAGSAVIDTTTSTPETTRTIADQLAGRDVTVLGAPVSGGVSGAAAGSLAVMVGGDRATFDACSEYFDVIGSNVFYVGPDPGHGHAIKLLNNFLSNTAMVATAEAVVLGEQIGLDIETMCDIFSVSSGRNSATEDKFPDYVAEDEEYGFALGLMDKDLRLLSQFADDNDLPLLMASVVRSQVIGTKNRFGADGDMVDVYEYMRSTMTGR